MVDARKAVNSFDLDRLVAPLSSDQFLERYWEKEPLVVHRGDETYYDALLSLDALDHILADATPPRSNLRLVRYAGEHEAEAIPLRRDGSVDVDGLYAAYADGATIVLNGLHRAWRPLLALCRQLEQRFSHPFQTNVYLTPPTAQGLGPHFDTHDVFVLQIAGAKKWQLYGAAEETPLAAQYRSVERQDLGTPTQSFVLKPGGMIYIPRGRAHEAMACDQTSLHITLGVLSRCWSDALRAAVDTYCQHNAAARRALPVGFADNRQARALAMSGLGQWMTRMAAEVEPGAVVDALAERFAQDRQPLLGGYLCDLARLGDMSGQTVVQRRAGIICRWDRDRDRVGLNFHDKCILFPDFVAASLESLAKGAPVRVSDISGTLDEAGRLVLARRLVKEGFLEITRISA